MFTRFCARKFIIFPLILVLSGMLIFAQGSNDQYEDYSTLIERLMKEQEARDKAQQEKNNIEETKPEVIEVEPAEVEAAEPEVEAAPAEVSDVPDVPEVIAPETPETEAPVEEIPVEAPVAEAPETETTEPPLAEESQPQTEEAATQTEEEKHKYEALAMIRYKNTDSINFKLKISYIPKPYILGISFAAGYSAYKLIQPFYFGGYLEPHIGIPQKKFPFKYELDGEAIGGPLIMGGKLYAPFGICVFPFQRNIEVFIEFEPGITFDFLWNAKFGKKSITSKLYPAFYAAIRTGASYKNITVFAEGNYDAILGFGVSLGVGYNFNIQYNTRADDINSLEDETDQ